MPLAPVLLRSSDPDQNGTVEMMGQTAVALVIAAASAMGVGGAAWLLMFRPFGQMAAQEAAKPAAQRRGHPSINWSRGA